MTKFTSKVHGKSAPMAASTRAQSVPSQSTMAVWLPDAVLRVGEGALGGGLADQERVVVPVDLLLLGGAVRAVEVGAVEGAVERIGAVVRDDGEGAVAVVDEAEAAAAVAVVVAGCCSRSGSASYSL